ncbi:two-component regulator propeller domain-containing protein [Rubrivirga sp.]|uniref:sensor histidine kinase n=1 Tax=Rubrivirga sp. TaxID=1885344 RepID=UPI003B517025
MATLSLTLSFSDASPLPTIVRRALLALSLAAACADAQPAFDTLTRADGLPSDYVQAVFQDRYGFLWFGTDAGLARYDGRHVLTFTADDGLPDPFVYAVGEDGEGTLWVGTFAGLARSEGAAFVAVSTPFGDESVLSVGPGPGGAVMIRTGTRTAIRQGEGWRVVESGPGNGWSGALPLDDGSVLISRRLRATDDGPWELVRHPPGRGAPVPVRTPATLAGPRWVSPADDGRLFLAGREQVALGRVERDRFVAEAVYAAADARRMALGARGEVYTIGDDGGVWVADAPGASPVRLSATRGQDLVVDREGSVWVGTFGGGALRLAGRHLAHLTDRPASRIAVDGAVVWATDADGLVRIDARTLDVRARSFGVGLREVAVARPGLMVSTGASAGRLADPMTSARVPVLNDANWVSGLDARTDTLWASGYGTGVVRWVAGRVLDTLRADRLGTDMVEGLVRTPRGVWALTRSDGATLIHGTRTTTVGRRQGLPSSAVYSVAEAGGAVWFGTDRGLGRYDGRSVQVVGEEALGGQRILAVFERPGVPGVTAVGDRGLYHVEGDRVRSLGAVLLGPAEGASINAATYARHADRLFLATTAGVVAVDLRRLPDVTTAPRMALLGLRVDDRARSLAGTPLEGRAVDLPPGRHRVEIAFAALFYRAAAGVEYRVGEGPWQPTGPEQRVVFSDLGPGEHRIEARAVGPDGAASPSARLTLRVAPQWWERPSVVGMLVALGLVGFAAAVRTLSQRRLRRQVERLEVGRRVQAERERISRDLHDHVGAQLSSLLAGVELAKLARRAGGDGVPADPLETIEEDARETIRQLRETIWALHDEALTADAFCHRLDAYARRAAKGRIGQVEVRCEGGPEHELPPAVALGLFRIAQEAITNALKHSGARSLTVTLRAAAGSTTLVVADDGRFVAGDDRDLSGFGIGSMRARARALGGTLRLDTEAGTCVTVEVPSERRPSPA